MKEWVTFKKNLNKEFLQIKIFNFFLVSLCITYFTRILIHYLHQS